MDTLARIRKLCKEKLDIKEDMLVPDATLDSLGLDSLDKIEFLFSLEEEFKIKIPDRDITIVTLGDVVTAVDKLIAEQRSAT